MNWFWMLTKFDYFLPGDFQQTKVWCNEKSLRTQRVVWLWNRFDNLQFVQQIVSICVNWYGQNTTQIHRIQWASWVFDQQKYNWRKYFKEILQDFWNISLTNWSLFWPWRSCLKYLHCLQKVFTPPYFWVWP